MINLLTGKNQSCWKDCVINLLFSKILSTDSLDTRKRGSHARAQMFYDTSFTIVPDYSTLLC